MHRVYAKLKQYMMANPFDVLAYVLIISVSTLAFKLLATDAFWFLDDGPAYILLSKLFSPYFTYSDIIIEGAKKENYPPFFPLILAVFGASNSFLYAHLIVAGCFTLGLFGLYWFAKIIFKDAKYAFLSLLFYCLTPGVFLGILGVLSEPLYIALTCIFLIYYHIHWSKQKPSSLDIAVLTILLTCIILTRSIGISLVTAIFIVKLLETKNMLFLKNKAFLIPILIPGLLALLWHYFRPVLGDSLYEGYVVEVSKNVITSPIELIKPQLSSLIEAWHSNLHIYWKHDFSPVYILSSFLGILALITLFVRLKHNKIDAWYLLGYITIILVWPHPEQQVRFLFPVLPLVIVYIYYFVQFVQQKYMTNKLARYIHVFSTLIMLSIVVPPMAFIKNRLDDANHTQKERALLVTYYHPSKDIARLNAKLNRLLISDMKKLKSSTTQKDIILWYLPKYIYLLAERRSYEIPSIDNKRLFMQSILKSKANFAYISRFNPWDVNSTNYLHYVSEFSGFSQPIWTSHFYDTRTQKDKVFSTLLKINHKKLQLMLINTPIQSKNDIDK